MTRVSSVFALALFVLASGAADAKPSRAPCVPGKVDSFQTKFVSHRSGYFPHDSGMQGGLNDRLGIPLRTLQDYLKGKVSYVSVAMDHTDSRLPYGTVVRIPAIELAFNRCIEFRVVDTGGNFVGKGTQKIDICNDDEGLARAKHSNGAAEVYIIGRAR